MSPKRNYYRREFAASTKQKRHEQLTLIALALSILLRSKQRDHSLTSGKRVALRQM